MRQRNKAKKTRIIPFYQTWFFGDMLNVLYFPNSETTPSGSIAANQSFAIADGIWIAE